MSYNRKVELYRDEAGEYRWRRWSSSDVIAVSAEGYTNKEDAQRPAETEAFAYTAEFVDLTEEGKDE